MIYRVEDLLPRRLGACNVQTPPAFVVLQDAVVECPDGMIYSPLEVTQGVPPFGGVNGLDDFVAAGCDGTTSTCVVRILPLDRLRPRAAATST